MDHEATGNETRVASGSAPTDGQGSPLSIENKNLDLRDRSAEADGSGSDGSASNEATADGGEVTTSDPRGADRDTQVFNLFLEGNDEAYRTLYDLHERSLYLYIVRLVGSEGEAQDVFQDVWIRMYRLRGERASVSRFSGLLYTVARNLSMNAIRDKKVLPQVSIEDVSADTERSLRSREVDDADLRELFERALAQLPIAQREAFILREYNGYTYQEIAEIMSSTMVTAKTRAWRAREGLRKMIAAWLDLRPKA